MKLLEKPNSHAPSTRCAREKFPPRTAWRAQKSATAKKSREKSTAFFTGKPYIESLGSYSFLFRNYNPALCRWTTPDPSGFPDGANPNLLGNHAITSGFDPDGLAWKLKVNRSTTNSPIQGEVGMRLQQTTFSTTTPNNTITIDISTTFMTPAKNPTSSGKLVFSVDENGTISMQNADGYWYGATVYEDLFVSDRYQVATTISKENLSPHILHAVGITDGVKSTSGVTGVGITGAHGIGESVTWTHPVSVPAKARFDLEIEAYE